MADKNRKYRNKNTKEEWSNYRVIQLEENRLFELVSDDGNYHARYSFFPMSNGSFEMEYLEWVEDRDLENPATDVLEKLKNCLEN